MRSVLENKAGSIRVLFLLPVIILCMFVEDWVQTFLTEDVNLVVPESSHSFKFSHLLNI